jgi:hypothetical protein
MDHNNTTRILDADDTDVTLINNELVRDTLLLMGGMYYATMHSEAAHSTLTPSQRLVLLTSQVRSHCLGVWMGVIPTGR